MVPHLCGATLLASLKKSGGIRPIAIGEVLRRLTSKCLSSLVLPQVKQVLPPHQVGVGCSNGAEALVHSVKLILSNPSFSPDSKCVILDFSNAFNSIDRSALFIQVRSRFPVLSRWLECCYGAQPHLLFGDFTIPSCCGVQQGDPLGPFSFSLLLHPIVERLKSEVPGLLLKGWYLDDGVLCGSLDDLLAAISIIEEAGPPCGLHLNLSKSLLFLPPDRSDSHNPLPQAIPTSSEGFILLGAPVGPPSFCQSVISARVYNIRSSIQLLPQLEDSHSQCSLLRSCLGLPKFLCALRTTLPDIALPVVEDFDSIVFDCLSELTGGTLSSWSRLKAALPTRLGGVGLRQASLHSSAIFLSSVAASSGLIASLSGLEIPPSYIASALHSFGSATGINAASSLDDLDMPISQKSLSRLIDQSNYDHLLSISQDPRSRALLLSTSIPHAGDWLSALPAPNLGLHLLDSEFRLCLRYWLGIQIASDTSTCPVCSRLADPFGDHALACGGNNDRVTRHNAIRDVLFSAAQAAALSPRREVPSLIPESISRPADICLPSWTQGRPTALDVTVVSPLTNQHLPQAATVQGSALAVAEHRKRVVHFDNCRSVGVTFLPLALEFLGGWSNDAVITIKKIGYHLATRLGLSPAEVSSHLIQRLSVSLWRFNAQMWLG